MPTNHWWALALLLAGCGRANDPDHPALVRVGDQEIAARELERYEAGLPAHLRDHSPAGRRQHLQSLVDRLLLAGEAARLGLDQSPQVLQALEEQFNRKLIDQVVEEEVELKQQAPTEEEMKAAYERFQLGWQVWPAHILSATQAEAEEVVRALEGGADFAALAKERSRADDAVRGGDLGKFFGGEDAATPLREGAFGLEVGGFSQPIQTKDGFEVVKVLDKRRIPYEKMRDTIVTQMRRRKWAERREAYVQELKESFQVRFHGEAGQALLRAARGGALSPAEAAAPLISYRGGALLAGTCLQNLLQWTKGPLPADSLGLFTTLELWVLPDTLMVLQARAQGRGERPELRTWRQQKREELAVDQLFAEQISAHIKVEKEEVERHYQQHLDEYKVLPGEVRLTEVLVDSETEARRILQAAQVGEKLEALARKHSRRPALKPVGGHTYNPANGQLVVSSMYQSPYHEFYGDANTKDVGLLQGPLPVQGSYSVFRLDQPVVPQPLSLKQMFSPIRHRLHKQREAAVFEQYIAQLRRQNADRIEWDEEAIGRLKPEPAPPAK
ncbi:MAG: peptidyl-prolyl cis-trans isomerase [Candidatus Handelsmanbacteria bacterium]|nr:peptidyl-prolyl cis-trans isomerase [Candidatus Handelsmanbacteria bacterium]